MQRSIFILVTANALAITGGAWAHGGGLNKEGCHTRRSTGDYHCHGSANAPSLSRDSYSLTNSYVPSRATPSRHLIGTAAFANCAEVRAAGAAPVRRGDPGYGPHLDRDNDGIGCEPYRGRR